MPKALSLHSFSPDTKRVVIAGQKLADERRHKHVTSLHVLAALIDTVPSVAKAFAHVGASAAAVGLSAQEALAKDAGDSEGKSVLSREILALLKRAQREAGEEAEVHVGDLLNALACESEGAIKQVLESHGVKPGAFRGHLSEDAEPEVDDDERSQDDKAGSAMLRDFAAEVRGELKDATHAIERQRGVKLLSRLEAQLTGPDGIPDLRVRRGPYKLVLYRRGRDAEMSLTWELEAAALNLTVERKSINIVNRYVWNRHDKRWVKSDGTSGFYADLHALIREHFFPELNKS